MLNHALEVLPQFKVVCMLQDHLKYCALALSDELDAHGEFYHKLSDIFRPPSSISVRLHISQRNCHSPVPLTGVERVVLVLTGSC